MDRDNTENRYGRGEPGLPYTRVYAAIDLDAVAYNMERMRENLPREAGMMAVVKADGYGHGAAPVAWAAEPYVDMYGVATGGGAESETPRYFKAGSDSGAGS